MTSQAATIKNHLNRKICPIFLLITVSLFPNNNLRDPKSTNTFSVHGPFPGRVGFRVNKRNQLRTLLWQQIGAGG
jgi:hypothetical protein